MQCHQCKHEADVKAGKYADVPFEQTPCSQCTLQENSTGTKEFDDARVYEAGPVCEAGDTCHGEEEAESVMPVSALTAVVALLLALPPKTRDLVCLRHQGMRYTEIARKLGAKAGTVEMRHKRAMKKWTELQALFPVKTAKQERRRGAR
jgi:DNA-directed RNA polymerase specialized sigma24 family protein